MHHNIQNEEETQTRNKKSKSKTYDALQIWPLSRHAHKCACSWVGIGRTIEYLKQTKHGQHKENNTLARCIQCPPWCSWHAQWRWPGGRWLHQTWRSQAGSAGSTCPHQPGTKQVETCNFQDHTTFGILMEIWRWHLMTLPCWWWGQSIQQHKGIERSWEGCGVEFKGKVAKAVE